MENKGLLFIPDISGFTKFVNETDIEHSRLIIQELLELLINSNQIGLEVSEIEGDAILFYKFGEAPPPHDLYRQVEKMFCEFHKSLIAYDHRRFCQCKACMSSTDLTLKIVTHYGEFTDYNVKNFNKLIGKDVIVAHQLLKNDIAVHEYWLVTKNLMPAAPAGFANWMTWGISTKQTENGEIPFYYTQLGQLKKVIKEEPFPAPDLSTRAKMITVSREYETDIITLFHAVGDFNYRGRWQEGVKEVLEVSHFLPRVGTRCRCITDTGETVFYASSYSYQPDRIAFSETDEKDGSARYFLLEKKADRKIKLTIDLYHKKNFLKQIFFKLFRKKQTGRSLQKSLFNLDKVVKEIRLPPGELDSWTAANADRKQS